VVLALGAGPENKRKNEVNQTTRSINGLEIAEVLAMHMKLINKYLKWF
jgi:hypothetical protein